MAKWRGEKVRRPREEVQQFIDQLVQEMPPNRDLDDRTFGWEILGSWRRGAPNIGDLDIMIVTESGTFEDFTFPASFEVERRGERIAQGTYFVATDEQLLVSDPGDDINMDFWACKPNEVGAFSMFMTGPKALNIAQRAGALKLGYNLSQYGLLNREGKQIDNGTERDIYKRLGRQWLSPEERQQYAETPPDTEAPVKRYKVPSETNPNKTYIVTVKGLRGQTEIDPISARISCTCEAYKYSRILPQTCKHCTKVRVALIRKKANA